MAEPVQWVVCPGCRTKARIPVGAAGIRCQGCGGPLSYSYRDWLAQQPAPDARP